MISDPHTVSSPMDILHNRRPTQVHSFPSIGVLRVIGIPPFASTPDLCYGSGYRRIASSTLFVGMAVGFLGSAIEFFDCIANSTRYPVCVPYDTQSSVGWKRLIGLFREAHAAPKWENARRSRRAVIINVCRRGRSRSEEQNSDVGFRKCPSTHHHTFSRTKRLIHSTLVPSKLLTRIPYNLLRIDLVLYRG